MQNNQIQCLPLGGQPVAVAKLQPAKPLPLGPPVPTFGKMKCCQLGDKRVITIAQMGHSPQKGEGNANNS